MQQTILALAAILAFSVFALNQHSTRAGVERTAIGSEIELAATDLARTRLANLTRFAFDEADTARDELRTDTDGLSTTLGPDTGEIDVALFDDIDDYHAYSEVVTTTWDGRPLQFVVTIAARYVNPDNASEGVSATTLAKELTVTVEEVTTGATDRPPIQCLLSQVITPAWNVLNG